MILRKVTGRTMAEALAKVAKKIGEDALIVETRFEGGRATVLAKRPEPAAPAARPASSRASRPWPRGFAVLAEEMLEKGIAERVVRVLYEAVRGLDPYLLKDGDPALAGVCRRILSGLIPGVRKEDEASPARRVLALVGPTGVGKTTTLAKLAARAALEQGERIAILTTDTYRIAAVDQLKAFAEMIGSPLRVVLSPGDLREALAEFGDAERVFVDTTGRSPRDAVALRAMQGWLRGLPAEVHLCLPCTGKRRDLEATLDSFAVFRPTHVLLTKWDESFAPGEALSLAIERNLKLRWFTDGQDVPEDLHPADPELLAGAILDGRER